MTTESARTALPALARIEAFDWVLVLGCGTGWTSRRAARSAYRGQVLALDARPENLARARELAAAQDIGNLRHADAALFPEALGAGDFDLAIVHDGLPPDGFRALAGLLAPGGRVIVETGEPATVGVLLTGAGFDAVSTGPGVATGTVALLGAGPGPEPGAGLR
ncbi:class I SAM-dependent methyltransferase [Phytomonospora sp. NPDC050363]|uniref:class I SAM-dependent methyltransferase n=1 Tax=Phytomonospora sp. NPDC050363 TaxID=3155642 RepID=UPI0033E351CE